MRGADKFQLLVNEDAVDFVIYRGDEEQTFILIRRVQHIFLIQFLNGKILYWHHQKVKP
jgi:hypothetical protein